MDSSQSLKNLKQIKTTTKDDKELQDQPLSPMARLFHEPGSNVYIITMMGCKTKIKPDVVKQNLVHSLFRHPRFSSLQVTDKETGNIKWVPTKANIDNHVIVPKLDPNIEFPDKFVEDFMSDLSKSPIEKSKPLWDLHLLDIKTSDAEGTGVFRFHHSLGDGLSLMTLCLACTRQSSDIDALPTLPVKKDSAYIKITSFWSLLKVLWNSILAVMMFVFTVLFLKDTETPLKGSIGVENRPRRFVRKSVSLADIKVVTKAMNVTLNDVVLGVTQAGLSRYLNRRYSEIGNVNKTDCHDKKNFIPKDVRLRATFFFNLRATTRIDSLVDSMKSGTLGRWGNQIGYVLLPFTVGLKSNPLDYVKEAKAVIDQKKASLEPLFAYFVVDLVLKLFGIKAVGKLNHKVFFNTTLWFSNVPGPQQEVTFYGHDVTYIAPSCYGQPNALMLHVVSYIDKLTFVISADEETIPDPHRLGDDLEECLHLIKASALARERGLDVLLSFASSTEASDFLLNGGQSWRLVFDTLVLWEGQDIPFNRIISLRIRGVPLLARDEVTFNRIGELFGKIVCPSDFSWNEEDVSGGRVFVLSNYRRLIDEQVCVNWRGSSFNAWVVEEPFTPWISSSALEDGSEDSISSQDLSDSDLEEGELEPLSASFKTSDEPRLDTDNETVVLSAREKEADLDSERLRDISHKNLQTDMECMGKGLKDSSPLRNSPVDHSADLDKGLLHSQDSISGSTFSSQLGPSSPTPIEPIPSFESIGPLPPLHSFGPFPSSAVAVSEPIVQPSSSSSLSAREIHVSLPATNRNPKKSKKGKSGPSHAHGQILMGGYKSTIRDNHLKSHLSSKAKQGSKKGDFSRSKDFDLLMADEVGELLGFNKRISANQVSSSSDFVAKNGF
ncbi:hypothetical protein SSX86_021394 [Deinandra increscens subsp. villosa]|uniref:Diacylglycerol O-acyltransferase n=1 Tax=Deinandra increscens subsp. villosa TaxID=3103831 RepID=A0AAP0GRN1_9ASTR